MPVSAKPVKGLQNQLISVAQAFCLTLQTSIWQQLEFQKNKFVGPRTTNTTMKI